MRPLSGRTELQRGGHECRTCSASARAGVPQSAPIPGSTQVPNSAGGFAWAVDDWTRLRRFLILGSEGGSYYASERELTRENAKAVARCIAEDGLRAVATIVRRQRSRVARRRTTRRSSRSRWQPVSATSRHGRAALDALPRVAERARTCSSSRSFVEGFRGWGRSLRRAVGRWYAAQPVDALAYQAVKYRQREGVTHRDLLRLAHPAAAVGSDNPTLDVSAEHASAVRVDRPRWRHRRPAAHRRGLRSRTGGGDAGARRRSSSASTACRVRRSRREHLASPVGVGGAARRDADRRR